MNKFKKFLLNSVLVVALCFFAYSSLPLKAASNSEEKVSVHTNVIPKKTEVIVKNESIVLKERIIADTTINPEMTESIIKDQTIEVKEHISAKKTEAIVKDQTVVVKERISVEK